MGKIVFPSVDIKAMVSWIGVNKTQITVPTLGGRNFINVNCPDMKTIHIKGSTGRTRDFNETYFEKNMSHYLHSRAPMNGINLHG